MVSSLIMTHVKIAHLKILKLNMILNVFSYRSGQGHSNNSWQGEDGYGLLPN